MAISYRLEVGQPGATVAYTTSYTQITAGGNVASSISGATASQSFTPKKFVFSSDTNNVVQISTELKKEKHRISNLTAQIYDPQFAILNQMQDPAFATIPVNLYMSTPNSASTPSILAFSGKVTSLQLGYPAFDKFTIVAHDSTIDMRRQKNYRTFKHLTSVQLAQQIAQKYGVTISAPALALKARNSSFQGEASDWDHLARELNYDGLELYTKGSQLIIRQAASEQYQTIFQKDKDPVITFEAVINHVGGDKSVGQTGSVALENSGTFLAASGARASEASKENAVTRSHRRPMGAHGSTGSHAEDPGNSGWSNSVAQIRRRKDTATLVCAAIPDIGLQHFAKLQGWGAKFDGAWYLNGIQHVIAGGSYPMTTLSMQRAPSQGASNTASIPFAT